MHEDLERRVEAIEAGYEYMLAYAAQGLPGDGGSGSSQIREYLLRFDTALTGLAQLFRAIVDGEGIPSPLDDARGDPERVEGSPSAAFYPFLDVLQRDADASQAAIRMVLAQPSISSQVVDNLNASIHVRALLTDIFLLDETLKAKPKG